MELQALRGWILAIYWGLTVHIAASRAAEPPGPADAMPEVLISGERPGPGMWRVTNGSHTLWILATLVPLPSRMTWRSHEVETRIANSQVVLAPPEIMADVGFFGDPAYWALLSRAEKNPNHRTLKQVLAPDLYSRWLALSTMYTARAYDDHVRPILAARDLFQGAVDKSGLTTDETVWKTVVKIAHRGHVKIQDVVVRLKMDNPENWIREFAEVPIGQEEACLDKTIDRVETDLEPMRHRANLWAVGDVDGLLALTFPDDRIACFNALFSVPRFHNQLAQAGSQLDNEWLAAADSALTRNESSFSVLPISQLLKPDGWLAKLRARGYSVQDPYGRDLR